MLIAFSAPAVYKMCVRKLPIALLHENTYAKLHGGREEIKTGSLGDLITTGNTGQVDESRLNDALLALGGLDHGLGKSRTGQLYNYCECGRKGPYRKPAKAMDRVAEPAPSLALTTSSPPNWTPVKRQYQAKVPHGKNSRTVDKSIRAVSGNLEAGGDLAEQWNNGLARVTTDNGHGSLRGVLELRELLGESLGTNNVEGGHTKQALGVEDTSGLEDLSGDGDGGVDRVRDDKDGGLGAELGDTLDEITNNAGVDLEEVITGHTRLACIPWLIGPSRPAV